MGVAFFLVEEDFFLVDFLAGVLEAAGSSAIGAADAMVLPTKPTAAKRAVAVRRMRLVMADTVFAVGGLW